MSFAKPLKVFNFTAIFWANTVIRISRIVGHLDSILFITRIHTHSYIIMTICLFRDFLVPESLSIKIYQKDKNAKFFFQNNSL